MATSALPTPLIRVFVFWNNDGVKLLLYLLETFVARMTVSACQEMKIVIIFISKLG